LCIPAAAFSWDAAGFLRLAAVTVAVAVGLLLLLLVSLLAVAFFAALGAAAFRGLNEYELRYTAEVKLPLQEACCTLAALLCIGI
jgi:hypothetical protein